MTRPTAPQSYSLEIQDGSRTRAVEGFSSRIAAEREARRLMAAGDDGRTIYVWAAKSRGADEIVTTFKIAMRPVLRVQKRGVWSERVLSKTPNPSKPRRRAKR